ncbi:Eukaryotic translation initiation factor 3 subunit A, partial [Tetrabaena socialis]
VKEGEKLEKGAVIKDLMSERIKEQQELERRMARFARNMDHLERARREEEAPYLESAWKERQEADRTYWENSQIEAARLHRQAWEVDIEEKKRLAYMMPDKDIFKGLIMQRREAEFQALRRERERRMAEMRTQRKYEREIARRKAYVTRCRSEVEARIKDMEEQRLKDIEAKKK